MRTVAIVIAAAILLSVPAAAQKKNDARTSLEFTGCVSDQPNASGAFTFTDVQTGGKFRLTGKRMQRYAGKTVSLVSGPNKGLTISGGLWPSPNIAAQAGAIDPAQASIARQPGGGAAGPAGADLPELHVVRVKSVGGSCR